MIAIHNANIVNEGCRYRGYVVVDGELIKDLGEGDLPESIKNNASEVVDAVGALLIPGCIDDHVHFRDPGLTHKADMASESRAAVAGGVTSFMDMPNTVPATTSVEALKAKMRNAAETSVANYAFFLGATNSNIEELVNADYSEVCGVKLFLGSSTGNMLVDDDDAIARIFREVPAVISVHSEDESIIRANKERYTSRFGNDLSVFFHPLIRSEEACYVCTARAVELAERCGTRLNVAHISTARELSLFTQGDIRAKRITAEACVPHLWFSDNDYASLGTLIKCNPAIKTVADRDALREAVNNGKIDLIATDHAPHLLGEKRGGALSAVSGSPYIQFSLIMMLELAHRGIIPLTRVVDKMCHAPAIRYAIGRRGFIRKGYYADLVLVDNAARHAVSRSEVLSKCGWSPLEGTVFHSHVLKTFVNGNCVYDNGLVDASMKGMPLRFGIC